MTRDFSWGASAREYGKIYDRARQVRATADAASHRGLEEGAGAGVVAPHVLYNVPRGT